MPKLANLLLILAITPLLMAADVYRWTDSNGVVNYTQRKPQGVNAVLISSSGRVRAQQEAAPVATQPARAPASGGGQLDDAQQKMLDELEAAESQRQQTYASARADNCERARRALEQLSIRGRVRVRGSDGAETILAEEDRLERIERAQQGVVDNCAPL